MKKQVAPVTGNYLVQFTFGLNIQQGILRISEADEKTSCSRHRDSEILEFPSLWQKHNAPVILAEVDVTAVTAGKS
jgi:hypothetical protein